MPELGEEVTFISHSASESKEDGLDKKTLLSIETAAMGDVDGVIFKRYDAACFVDPWTWSKRNVPLVLRFVAWGYDGEIYTSSGDYGITWTRDIRSWWPEAVSGDQWNHGTGCI